MSLQPLKSKIEKRMNVPYMVMLSLNQHFFLSFSYICILKLLLRTTLAVIVMARHDISQFKKGKEGENEGLSRFVLLDYS